MTITLPPVGSIGLVQVDGLEGKAIEAGELLDGSPLADARYQHAFVLVSNNSIADPMSVAQVIEAEPGGVRLSFLNEYHGRSVLWLPCPAEYQAAMVQAAMTYLHVPYSFADYPAIAAHHFGIEPLAEIIQHEVQGSGHVICSQLALVCAQKSGWPLTSEWPGYATPATLAAMAPQGAAAQLIA